jgi:shikimate kinase
MGKSVFRGDNDEWTDESREISSKFHKEIKRIFKEYPDVNFREIAAIAHGVISEIECVISLEKKIKKNG